jgi:simple sugar transport system substrate-binding protein
MKKFFIFCAVLVLGFFLTGFAAAAPKRESAGAGGKSIAVFVPGVMSGSPIYEMLARGVKEAAADYSRHNPGAGAEVTVIEGGFNQAEWESQVTALAASGNYDLIVSSNPSLPVIAGAVSAKFPQQRFLLLDGESRGNSRIYSLRYNQREQAYMAGYIAALAAAELAPQPRIGLVAGQEYPAMNGIILPGYTEGAEAAFPGIKVDFRVVGNWYDAAKGSELASDMIRGGAKVILCVAGGANEGVVQAASEAAAKVVWFDTAGYDVRPGTVTGSAVIHQDKAAYHKITLYLEGKLPFGAAETAGVREGYVDFVEDDPLYRSHVSPAIREKQAALIARIRSGDLILD